MNKNNKAIIGIIVAVVIIVGVVALVHKSGNNSSGMNRNMSSSSTNAVAANKVDIKNYMFSPMAIKVKVGTTVTWTNQDAVNHTVNADNNSADAPSSMDIAQGKSYSFTFKKAGTYTYHCFPHPYMHGTVDVTSS